MSYKYLPLEVVQAFIPYADELGVSKVARGPGGFIEAYELVDGNGPLLKKHYYSENQSWHQRREGFIKRHMAQVNNRGENLWKEGFPTRRHLALIMWAYSPNPSRLEDLIEP